MPMIAHTYPHLPQEVITLMASRVHRMHHYLWHQTRNSWARYPENTRQELAALGWKPPRVHQDWETNIVLDNHAGEDFLFMHRQMIQTVNGILRQTTGNAFARISGWTRVPEPNSKEYPVPPRYDHPDPALHEIAAIAKSDDYYEKHLLFWENLFRNPDYLRSVTLGRLGSMIEATIHDAMHMRWSALPTMGIRPDTAAQGTSGGILGIDSKWDDPAYDFLADEYAAHVHPLFWKIHGWVDDRISDWMIVNGVRIGFHTSMVDPPWLGTWQGVLPPPAKTGRTLSLEPPATVETPAGDSGHSGHGGHGHGNGAYLKNIERAVSVVLKSGIVHRIYGRAQGR